MRRFLLPLLALAACSDPPLDTSLKDPPVFGRVRVLALVDGAPTVDTLLAVKDELPVGVRGVRSPGISTFRAQPAGEVTAFLTQDGATRSSAKHAVVEDRLYTVVHAGSLTGAPEVATTWVDEAFEAAPGAARVRFIQGVPALGVTAVSLGPAALATAPALGAAGEWLELAAGSHALAISDANGALATFSDLPLADGDLRTLVLVRGDASRPVRLLVVEEKTDGAFTTSLRDPDGTVRPKAKIRLFHAASGVGAIDAAAGATLATGLTPRAATGYSDVDVDATLVASEGATAVATRALALQEGRSYTAALVGKAGAEGEPSLVVWEDERTAATPTARLAHALAGAPGTFELVDGAGATLLPATAFGAASAYAPVPAGPLDASIVLRVPFTPDPIPVATVSALSFPGDRPVTAALVGFFVPPPAQGQPASVEATLVLLDDADGPAIVEKEVTPASPPPP